MHLLLFPLYWLYRTGSRIKNLLYRKHILRSLQAPIRTLSVGNIVFGGSNKTPLAKHLLAFLKKQGYRPALVSRGYKGNWEKGGGILSDGKSIYGSWQDSGDEPFMVAQDIPGIGVFIGKNRLLSCQKAKELGFDVAILDDGFQHRRLEKDVDIVLLNPLEKISLREPVTSINRAQILLLEGDISPSLKRLIQNKASKTKIFTFSVINQGFFKIGEKGKKPLAVVLGKRVLAISGIARPERFFSLLEKQGITPCSVMKFPDHFRYPPPSIKRILAACNSHQIDAIITTEKDSVKLKKIQELRNIPVYFLKIDLAIEDGFYGKILSSLGKAERQER